MTFVRNHPCTSFLCGWPVIVEFFTRLSAFSSGQQGHFQVSNSRRRFCLHRIRMHAARWRLRAVTVTVPVMCFFIETDAQVCGHPGRCSSSACKCRTDETVVAPCRPVCRTSSLHDMMKSQTAAWPLCR